MGTLLDWRDPVPVANPVPVPIADRPVVQSRPLPPLTVDPERIVPEDWQVRYGAGVPRHRNADRMQLGQKALAVVLLLAADGPKRTNDLAPILFNRLMRAGLIEVVNLKVEGLGMILPHARLTARGHKAALLDLRVEAPGEAEDVGPGLSFDELEAELERRLGPA